MVTLQLADDRIPKIILIVRTNERKKERKKERKRHLPFFLILFGFKIHLSYASTKRRRRREETSVSHSILARPEI